MKVEEKRIKEDVITYLDKCHQASGEPYAILELDLKYFCTEALTTLIKSDIEF